MTDTTIYNFHTDFYILAIRKLAFHLPHIQILGKITVVNLVELFLKYTNHFKM